MSFLLKSQQQFSYLSNKEREKFFLYEDDDDDEFDFKYVPARQLKNVVKNVQRQKVKMEEERTWESFVKRQQSLEESDTMINNMHLQAMKNIEDFQRENMGNVDRELKRLQDDAMPEINQMYKSIDGVNALEGQPTVLKKSPLMKETGAGSSNILVTIPEEQKEHHTCRKLLKSKPKPAYSSRRSSSDHTVLKNDQCRKLLHIMDDSEYNSSPEPSPDRLSGREEGFFTRPDPIVVERILEMQKKVCSVLDEICFRLDRIPPPDGDRDFSRRLQRVAEFSVRFSRNYLYELGRQIAGMQQHVRAMSTNVQPKSARSFTFHLHAVGQKIITAHQILLQALNAYCKHIPSSILNGHPGKIREILQVVLDLNDMCKKVNITSEHYGSGDADIQPHTKDIHGKCSTILSKLQMRGLGSDNESQLMSHTTQSTIGAPLASSHPRRRIKQKRLSSRLSMYSTEANIAKLYPSQRPSTCIRKEQKYSSTNSRYLNYNQSMTSQKPNPSSATVKPSSKENIRAYPTKVKCPPREDDILTMIDVLPPAELDVGSSVEMVPTKRYVNGNLPFTKSEIPRQSSTRHQIPSHRIAEKEPRKLKSSKNLFNDQELTKRVTMITDEHLSSLVPVIADLMSMVTSKHNELEIRPMSSASMETLLEFLHKYQSPQNYTPTTTSPILNRSKEIRSGSKNMQLISLPYDEKSEKESKCSDFPSKMNLETLCETSEFPVEVATLRPVNSNNESIHLIVPRIMDSAIPEYQHRYQCFIQESPMYLSNTNNKPWDLVSWIADKLVDELVAEISKELQMDNVIKKMFDLEFEEF